MKKIAIINTNPLTYDMLNTLFAKEIPEAEVFNILDDSLLPQARKTGVTEDILEKMRMYIKCAEINGADIILNQCSSVSAAVDILKDEVSVPYIKIDGPMAEKAVSLGKNITVLATVESTLEPSLRLIESTAERLNRKINAKTVLVKGAIDMLSEPDGEKKHNALILEEIEKQSPDCDVIVLAQASMHRIMDNLKETPVPVLSSPATAVAEIKRMLNC